MEQQNQPNDPYDLLSKLACFRLGEVFEQYRLGEIEKITFIKHRHSNVRSGHSGVYIHMDVFMRVDLVWLDAETKIDPYLVQCRQLISDFSAGLRVEFDEVWEADTVV